MSHWPRDLLKLLMALCVCLSMQIYMKTNLALPSGGMSLELLSHVGISCVGNGAHCRPLLATRYQSEPCPPGRKPPLRLGFPLKTA